MTVYADSDVSHDHTYYGNGCPNAWSDGSITPCSDSDGGGRFTNTADSETQEIGTYYSFAASTSGTGGTMTTSNTNSPDTFCPLGWQLPYSGTGGDYYDKSKSRKYLFTIYGIENNPIGSSKTRSYPISKILSGFYFSAWGKLYYKNGVAYYWSSTVNNLNEAARMYMYSGVVTEEWWGKTAAQTLRCSLVLASFIDGTVAGTPADLTTYADNNYEHDHTYYGRGCKRDWGTSGEGGSQTPCVDSDAGGRYVMTADGETQKNGTLYNFQAATVGSGGVITSGDSPNTVCPLGWQLPYSGTSGDYYDKSKSWNYLFTTYGIAFNNGTVEDSTKVRSYPFSYAYSGDFNWYSGRLYYQDIRGLHWSSTIVSGASGGYNLITQYSVVKVIGTYGKSDGLAFRCVTRY